MRRLIINELIKWKNDSYRKPLIIRGARQVGKTYIIRELGKEFKDFQEINFEQYPEIVKVFNKDLDPKRIIRDLTLFTKKNIIPGKTLLFLDEIQEAPKAIKALRYFHEIIPDLHIIAAGSIIDFELDKIGLPVGRIYSIYLYPLSFLEFLLAKDENLLVNTIISNKETKKISELAHNRLIVLIGEYMTVGGMPEAIKCFIETSDINKCYKIHKSIVETYRQDFNKFAKKYQLKYVELLFETIPTILCEKFKYSKIPGEYRKRDLNPSLDLLIKAGIVKKIFHSSGQGIPLSATMKPEIFKTIFLDIALSQTILGHDRKSWLLEPENFLINKGSITEAFIGQELLAYSDPFKKRRLFYWNREVRGSNAEVDYLIQKNNVIIPIEVKSGPTGKLKSLKLFLKSHKASPYGIQLSVSNFSKDKNIHTYPIYSLFKLFNNNYYN